MPLPPPVSLRRALGRWDLTAIGINQVIGGAVFLMPSQVAAQVGPWAPIAFVLVGLASMLVALCFAEVSSRFEGSGGAYLYAREAFGQFAGFEVGWMQWFTRVASQASVMSGLALALGYYWPSVTASFGRALLLALTTALAVEESTKKSVLRVFVVTAERRHAAVRVSLKGIVRHFLYQRGRLIHG